MDDQGEQITLLLQRIRGGDRDAESELMPIVYAHLHSLAERQFRSERYGHTLQPTVLMSELYLRIIRDSSIDWKSRAHFYNVAATTIRRILVDYARTVNAEKRPKPNQRLDLDDLVVYSEDRADGILIIDEALNRLKGWDERQAKIVELRFFGGLSVEETAELLQVSERTVKRDWKMARAWLSTELGGPKANAARQ
jgi:RNA polymerase sigma-70 factor (ECF subfamily)